MVVDPRTLDARPTAVALRRRALAGCVHALALTACADTSGDGTPWVATMTLGSADASGTSAAEGTDDAPGSTGSPTSSDSADSGPRHDLGGDTTGGIDCTAPDPAPDWLLAQLQDVVGRLSGDRDIDGVYLPDRATAQRRGVVAAWLLQYYAGLGIDAASDDYGSGTNIVATIPATTTSQGTLVLGAHYDSVPDGPGADDNATGIAVITAAARYLATVPCRTHDVRIVAFDEEELGLVGSTAYAAKLAVDGIDVTSVHTIDQIGWDGDGDRVLEVERPDTGLFEFYDDVADDVPAIGGLTITDSGFTDHVAFREAGFIAVGLSEEYVSGDTTPHYHLPSDRYDTVDFGMVAAAATLVNHAFASAITP